MRDTVDRHEPYIHLFIPKKTAIFQRVQAQEIGRVKEGIKRGDKRSNSNHTIDFHISLIILLSREK
jgi:hypothetical protein